MIRQLPIDTPQEHESRGLSVRELIKSALALVPVAAALVQHEAARFWGLLGFGLLLLAASFYRGIGAQVRSWSRARRERRLARQSFPQLFKLVQRFAEFVDINRNDTLHAILSSEVLGHSRDLRGMDVAALTLLSGFWGRLRDRMARSPTSVNNLSDALADFDNLLWAYESFCVQPVFERFPRDLHAQLTPKARSELEAFRSRYVLFRSSYGNFARDVAGELSAAHLNLFSTPLPKPLE